MQVNNRWFIQANVKILQLQSLLKDDDIQRAYDKVEVNDMWFIQGHMKMILHSLLKDDISTTDTIYKEHVTRWKSMICDSSKEIWRWYYRVCWKMTSKPQTPSTKSMWQGGSQWYVIHPRKYEDDITESIERWHLNHRHHLQRACDKVEVNDMWFIQGHMKMILHSLLKDDISTTDTIYKEPKTSCKSSAGDLSNANVKLILQ